MEEFEYRPDEDVWVCGQYRLVRHRNSWRLRRDGTALDVRFPDWLSGAQHASALMAVDAEEQRRAEEREDEERGRAVAAEEETPME